MESMRLWLLLPPFLLVTVATVEAWVLMRRGRHYDWKGFLASLGDVLGRTLVNLLLQGGVVGVLLYALWDLRIATLAMDRWWHWVLLFVGQEFCYYWMHRADHRVRWFWLNHSVHHSSRQYNFSAAYRLGWTGKLTGATIFFGPLVWLGFPVPYVIGALTVNLLYQFWLHTELIGTLPRPIEFLFNTPAHHRVHHASNPAYLDCNYGGALIIFDRIFGTFRRVRADEPPRYGLVEPLDTYNPMRIVAHAWVGMFHDLRLARGWRETWKVVFGPPGYRPQAAKENQYVALTQD